MSAFVDKNGEKRINVVLISHIANQPLVPPQPAQLSCTAIAYLLDMQSYFSRVEFPITNEVRRLVLEQFASYKNITRICDLLFIKVLFIDMHSRIRKIPNYCSSM